MNKSETEEKHKNMLEETEEVDEEILEKFSDESKMRNFDNKKVIAGIVFIIAILYSAFHLWI